MDRLKYQIRDELYLHTVYRVNSAFKRFQSTYINLVKSPSGQASDLMRSNRWERHCAAQFYESLSNRTLRSSRNTPKAVVCPFNEPKYRNKNGNGSTQTEKNPLQFWIKGFFAVMSFQK